MPASLQSTSLQSTSLRSSLRSLRSFLRSFLRSVLLRPALLRPAGLRSRASAFAVGVRHAAARLPVALVALLVVAGLAAGPAAGPAHAQTADLQVIHNAAGFGDVDIYVLDSGGSELAKLDDFPFRGALVAGLPADEELTVTVNGPASTASDDAQVASVSGIILTQNTFNQAFAVGEDGADFELLLITDETAAAAGGPGTVDLLVGHQSPDAPAVDVLTRGLVAVDGFTYKTFASSNPSDPYTYISVPFEDYILRIGPDDNAAFVASFAAPLTALGVDDNSVAVLASGFLNPGTNEPAFALIAVPPANISADADEVAEASNADQNVVVLGAAPQGLVVNEYLANPTDAQDANGDGTNGGDSDEEFVEVVNVSGMAMDVSGYVIEDGAGNTYTFPDGTTLVDRQAAVVFGGGTPTGIETFTDTGLPALNNPGDDIILMDDQGTVLDRITYAAFAPVAEGESSTRAPDFFGGLALSATGLGGPDFTPGRSNDGGTALPVELAGFTGTADGADVVLNWRTLSETNNRGFEVQRRIDEAFETIGFRRGQGTTTEAVRYRFRVRDLEPGTYAFRLRQVDVDGTASTSPTVEVTVGLREAYRMTTPAPNPLAGTARLRLQVRQSQAVTVRLYDLLGREVRTLYRGPLEAGRSRSITVDARGLAGGTYLIRAEGEHFATSKRLTVVR